MKYPVFIQALALTIVVFLIGMYIGVVIEENRLTEMNDYFVDSEVMLLDTMAYKNLIGSSTADCEMLKKADSDLLNEVYNQAILLEDFENSGKMTENLISLHKKYDALRVSMWINSIELKKRCGENFNTVVYLYKYGEEELTKRAEQNVWSRVLYEIKQENEDNVVLIPIAVDTNLKSLDILLSEYGVTSYPSVIVNEKTVFSELVTKEDVLAALE